jgi:hypothetical protein
MNPWLDIPLEDYEAHMSLASVAQAQFLAETLGATVQLCSAESVAILGCSGGNGFDRLFAVPQILSRSMITGPLVTTIVPFLEKVMGAS